MPGRGSAGTRGIGTEPGSFGSLPAATSSPSLKVSPSVSASSGSVPVSPGPTKIPVLVSTPSSRPSPSVSASSGSVPVSPGPTKTSRVRLDRVEQAVAVVVGVADVAGVIAVGVELVEIVRGRTVVEAVEHGVLVAVDAHARAGARRRAGVGERTLASSPTRAARRRRSCRRGRPGTGPTTTASTRAARRRRCPSRSDRIR